MEQKAELKATVEMRGAFECRDKDGNVVKVIEFKGSVPLVQLKEPENGTDRSE